MKKFSLSLILALCLMLPATEAFTSTAGAPVCSQVNALDIVNRPSAYLNKNIKIIGTFNKFSTLGLDYKPAMKSSKEYISFLIKRDNTGSQIIPLSEAKFFIKKEKAEKLNNLETGDKVEITGKVFSTAMGDVWVDVYELKNMSPRPDKK